MVSSKPVINREGRTEVYPVSSTTHRPHTVWITCPRVIPCSTTHAPPHTHIRTLRMLGQLPFHTVWIMRPPPPLSLP